MGRNGDNGKSKLHDKFDLAGKSKLL